LFELSVSLTHRISGSSGKSERGVNRTLRLLRDGESLESAFKHFKRKVAQEDIIKDIKSHAFYLKPRQKKRAKVALACKRARKKRSHDSQSDQRPGTWAAPLPETLPGRVHHRGVAGA
jgi:small subunit ribosomal protein S21